ncbi:MAG: hypothetical protein R3F49_05315 [Planctomycetota bacterium]
MNAEARVAEIANQPDAARERVALAEHMQSAVRGPLAALRAVLEGQRRRAAFADRALGELVAVENAVDDLWRWCAPMPLRKLECSLTDIVASLRSGLEERERQRLWVLVEEGGLTLHTDGVLLVATLRRFARASLNRDTQELLLHAHADADSVTLSIVDDPPHVSPTDSDEDHLDLPLMIGRRDVARLGGTCTVHHTTPRHRCIVLRFPRREVSA